MSARNSVASRKAAMYEEASRDLSDEEKGRLDRRKTAPKKYLDPERTILTPEYAYWHGQRERKDDPWGRLATVADAFGMGDVVANHQIYFPEEYDKELGDGHWIFVIEVPHTELAHRFEVPLLSIWWARPHVLNRGEMEGRLPYQAVIQTPGGDLHLWPHEYTLLTRPEGIIGEEGTYFHSLDGQPVVDEEMLFYLMSRGLTQREATLMLFEHIEDGSGFGYITLHPDLVEIFAGVGTTLVSHMRNNPRETA